jgi:hypothetical protein
MRSVVLRVGGILMIAALAGMLMAERPEVASPAVAGGAWREPSPPAPHPSISVDWAAAFGVGQTPAETNPSMDATPQDRDTPGAILALIERSDGAFF